MTNEELIRAVELTAAFLLERGDKSSLPAFAKFVTEFLLKQNPSPESEAGEVCDGVCFECGALGLVHRHHVVPRILKGTKTVDLCEMHHGIVHGLDMTNHGNLIRKGLENARRNGKVLGRREGVTEPVEKFLSKHRDVTAIIQRRPSSSVRELAARTKKSTATIAKIKRILRAA